MLESLLPDTVAVSMVAEQLERPVDPVVADWLSIHLGYWDLEVASRIDIGPVRDRQEDGVFCCPEARMFAVVDGMGGQGTGMFATQVVLDRLAHDVPTGLLARAGPPADNPLSDTVHRVNLAVYEAMHRERHVVAAMATLAATSVQHHTLHVAHVGDCRVMLFRDGALQQLTRDHTLLDELVDGYHRGELGPRAQSRSLDALLASAERHRNVVTRVVGHLPEIDVATTEVRLEPGDLVLLCTDGLHGAVPAEAIEVVLCEGASGPVEVLADRLMSEALEQTHDNVALVLFRV